MSLTSAASAGVAGLAANASRLATISDNIANSATYGYKRMESEFDSFVIGEGGGAYSAGGVRVSAYREVDGSGSLIGTSNALDIAVSGSGMIPVTGLANVNDEPATRPMLLTRTGGFRPDEHGILRTPESGLVLMGWPAAADGSIPTQPRESTVGLVPVRISATPGTNPTRNISLGVILPAEKAKKGGTGEPLPYYDVDYFGNLGNNEKLRLNFTPIVPENNAADVRSNEWNIKITDLAQSGDGAEVADITVKFFENEPDSVYGSIKEVSGVDAGNYDPETGILTITVASGDISINIGKPNDPKGPLQQLSTEFQPTHIEKDGSAVGIIDSIKIDDLGYVKATYSTGFTQILYQVPVVVVPNFNGLKANSAQTFSLSPDSGGFFLWDAGDGPAGDIQGYAREASTTDIAAELTNMIQTQRAFSSNAKIIQTVDEMMQETTNIKR